MKVSELKKIFEIPFQLKKSFVPITEYVYVKDNVVKSTDMESYIEVTTDVETPFNGCVLSDQFNKFLNSLNKDEDLTFETNSNVLTVHYGKKNKFFIPMENVDDFPDSPSIKFTENNLVYTLHLTKELLEKFDKALQFVSRVDSQFNGIYLKNNKIYSSDRAIIFIDELDTDIETTVFVSTNLLKFVAKHDIFKTIEVYDCGFKAIGDGVVMYSSSYTENKCPDFDKVASRYTPFLDIDVTEEIKASINRISSFDEIVNICLKNNTMNIYTNNINEIVEMSHSVGDEEFTFKFTIDYLNKIVKSKIVGFMKTENSNNVEAVYGITGVSKIIAAVV